MAECPPMEILERLLREELGDPDLARVLAHVEECAACQETLHGLARIAPGPTPLLLRSALSEATLKDPSAEADLLFRRLKRAMSSRNEPLPEVVGYEILEEIGRGGVGIVYRARHRALNRFVALKMIMGGPHLSPERRERFQREAQAVARLQHPNIVQVHEVGEQAGRPYLALELVEGGNLAGWLSGVPRPPAQAAQIVATLARAVEYAHGQGVIHRDLKPANILLNSAVRGGRSEKEDRLPSAPSSLATLKITDFGLAKLMPEPGMDANQMTPSGAIMGTPVYVAPEQARGDAAMVGPPADVYSLGVILYETLTGRPPFQGATPMETLMQAAHQDPVSPARLVSGVPRDLDTICLKCLEKDPQKRYATAGELAADLERFLRREPILARPVGRMERFLRWVRRHVGLTAALAGIGLLLVLLIVGSLLSAAHFREMEQQQRGLALAKGRLAEEKEIEREKAVRAQLREAGLRSLAEKQGRELRRSLYFAGMNLGGQTAMSPSGIGRVSEWLAPWENERPDLRDWEWYYLKGLCHHDLFTLRGHRGGALAVAWSKDGRLASAAADGVVRLWDAKEGCEARSLKGHKGAAWSLAWSPDGKRLASAGWDGTVKIWDAANSKELLAFRGHAGEVFSVAWRRDGKRLASGGADQTVQIWNAADGVAVYVLRGHTKAVAGVAWSADGKRLASASRDFTIRLWDAEAGKEEQTLTGHINWVNSVAWSPDGKRLASASNDQTVKVWSLPAKGNAPLTLRGHAQGVVSAAWSPDGARLATGSEDQTVKIWSAAGAEIGTLRGHTGSVTSMAWSLDGSRLASASFDATVKVWDADAGPETPVLRGHESPVNALAWRRDNQRLASAGEDGAIKIWDMAQGKEQITLRGHKGPVRSAAWSPDSSRLASAGDDQVIHLWDAVNHKEAKSFRGHTGIVYSVVWSPDGRRLASAGMDQTVRIWDAATGEEKQICRGHEAQVNSAAWSPDGARLASASGDRTVRIWNATTGQETHTLRVHTGAIKSVAWSPDGTRLASAGYDQTIKIVDSVTGTVTLTLLGHTSRVNAVAWNPAGTRLASVSEDRTVKIWDAATGKVALTLGGHRNQVYAAAWSPDGLALVSAGIDQTILIHDAAPGCVAVRSPRYLPTLDRRLKADPKNGADWRLRAEIHARLGHWDKAGADLQHYLALNRNKRWFTLDCWVVGPYPEDLKASYPPDKSQNPGQRIAGAGKPSSLLNWQSVPLTTQGFVNFGPLFGHAEHISAYALLRVYSPEKQGVAILVGSDDYVQLRLNGKRIHEHLVRRGAKADEDAIAGTLEPGWNTLLARVVNVTGAHALYWRLSAAPADLRRARSEVRR